LALRRTPTAVEVCTTSRLCSPGGLRRLWRALRASAPKFWAVNPAAVDLVDVEVEVEEITVDAGQAKTPSGCGALDLVLG
jgi:hypothetical protein